MTAFATYVGALAPSHSSPTSTFFNTFLALYNNVESVLRALARPPQTITRIHAVRRDAERSYNSLSRASRWPLGLSLPAVLDGETRQRRDKEEKEERVRKSEGEAEDLARELRYAQQTVAGELAGWRDMHERMGRRAIRELARGMVVGERMRLEGMRRALRTVREGGGGGGIDGDGGGELGGGGVDFGNGSGSGSGSAAGSGGVRAAEMGGGRSPLVGGGTGQAGEGSGSW
jgi:hypothetical protein